MHISAINSDVLGGQGSIGSKSLTVSNPAPAQGPAAGEAIGFPQADASASAAAAVGVLMPATYPLSGPSAEPASQYDTIKPIPQG